MILGGAVEGRKGQEKAQCSGMKRGKKRSNSTRSRGTNGVKSGVLQEGCGKNGHFLKGMALTVSWLLILVKTRG